MVLFKSFELGRFYLEFDRQITGDSKGVIFE